MGLYNVIQNGLYGKRAGEVVALVDEQAAPLVAAGKLAPCDLEGSMLGEILDSTEPGADVSVVTRVGDDSAAVEQVDGLTETEIEADKNATEAIGTPARRPRARRSSDPDA